MKEENDILFFAFRYCLGRRTYVSGYMVDILIKRWDKLSKRFKEQLQREIRLEIDNGLAGADMDVEEWKKILELQ